MMRYSAAEEPCLNDAAVVNLDPEADPDDSHYHQNQFPKGFVSSSKPTILPPNALRLHLTDPSVPLTTPHDPAHPPSDPLNIQGRPSRVRFRSRVRITSGFSHRRRKSDVGSSRSDSPSSSISAPLRSHSDSSTNTWGTLGQRVGLLALQRKIMGSPKAQQRQKGQIAPSEYVDERTPLRNSINHSSYVDGEGVRNGNIFDEDSDDEGLSRDVDEVFGKFPGRLLNYHVSSSPLLAHDSPLINMVISGGIGSWNQLYVVIIYAVIMPPTWSSCILSTPLDLEKSCLSSSCASPHVFAHSILPIHDN